MPSAGPRRSGRHVKDGVGMRMTDPNSTAGTRTARKIKEEEQEEKQEESVSSGLGRGRSKKSNSDDNKDGNKKKKKQKADEMDIAMEGLREMEDSFRDAVKRQKLAVGETSFNVPASAMHEETKILKKQMKTTGTSEMLAATEEDERTKEDQERALGWGRTPPREKIDQAPESPCESEAEAEADNAPPEDESSAIKLAAWRPPPVNSDILPLPWKGRLGYVSDNSGSRSETMEANPQPTARHVSIHISACQTHQYSAPGHAG